MLDEFLLQLAITCHWYRRVTFVHRSRVTSDWRVKDDLWAPHRLATKARATKDDKFDMYSLAPVKVRRGPDGVYTPELKLYVHNGTWGTEYDARSLNWKTVRVQVTFAAWPAAYPPSS